MDPRKTEPTLGSSTTATDGNAANQSEQILDYQEHMDQRHHAAGQKVNQTIVTEKRQPYWGDQPTMLKNHMEELDRQRNENGPTPAEQATKQKIAGTEVNSEQIKASWKEQHPDLYQEMIKNDVPLDAEERKKKGYSIFRSKDGKESVLYPTPEYVEWLQSDRKTEPPRMRETLDEKRMREQQEEKQKAIIKRRETIYRNGLENLGVEESSLDALCDEMFPEISLPEVEKKDAVLLASRWLDKRWDALEQDSGRGAYHNACYRQMMEQISSDSSNYEGISFEQYVDAYCDYLEKNCAVRNVMQDRKPKYSSRSIDIAQKLLADSQRDLFAEKFEEKFDSIDQDERTQWEQHALRSLISAGFLRQDVEAKRNSIDSLFEKTGLNKDSVEVTEAIIEGCDPNILGPKARRKFADFFGLDDRICEVLNQDYQTLTLSVYGDRLSFRSDTRGTINIPSDLTPKTLEKIYGYRDEITDDIAANKEFQREEKEQLEKEKYRSADRIRRDIYYWDTEWNGRDIDFSKILDEQFVPDVSKKMEQIVRMMATNNRHGWLFRGKDDGFLLAYDSLHTESIDNKDAIKKALIYRLARGVESRKERRGVRSAYESEGHWDSDGGGWRWTLPYNVERRVQKIESSKKTRYLTDIFETDSFKENQERIGLDFADPEVFDAAFSGFIRTIETPNGEKTEQVSWYSNNVFVHDPEKFLSRLKAYRESGKCSRGMETKINRFLDQDSMISEFYRQQQSEQVPEVRIRQPENESVNELIEEDMDSPIVSETSILQRAELKDVSALIRRRQEELVTLIEDMGADKINTFPYAKEFPTGENRQEHTDNDHAEKNTPIDFGVKKVEATVRYYNFIKNNIPDSEPEWFIDTFPGEGELEEDNGDKFAGVKLDSPRSYIGFSFIYEGKLCVISESFGDPASMYLFCGEPGSNFKRMYDMSKMDARADANVATVNHLDKQHIDEDLDAAYQRAFIFFRTGDKNSVYYGFKGNQARWEANQSEVFPAWPLGVTNNNGEYADEIERYQAWQTRQINERPDAEI